MADTSSASLNVHECSWADLSYTLNVPGGATASLLDLEAAKWARKLERSESRGTSGRPKKRTRGSPSYEASATATRAGWMQIIEAVEQAALQLGRTRDDSVIIGGIDFDALIQHTPFGDSRIYAVKLVGCTLLGDSSDMKQGNEADMIEMDLNPLEIKVKSSTGNWLVFA